jgi:SAM-dependent methyltransferase
MGNKSNLEKIRNNAVEIVQALFGVTEPLSTQLDMVPENRDHDSIEKQLIILDNLRLKARRALREYQGYNKKRAPTVGRISLKQRQDQIHDRALFGTLADCLKKWAHAVNAIRRQIAGDAHPLYAEPRDFHDRQTQQTGALDAVFVAMHKLANPAKQSSDAHDLGCHADIALFPSVFVADAHAAFRVRLAQRCPNPARFLDIGCGGGVKVMLAAQFFGRVEGLEYDAGYAQEARRVQDQIATAPGEIIQGNALEFDRYDEYDVLYFYQPMMLGSGLAALEERIAAHARPGTILIAPYPQFASRASELGCAHVAGHIFLAKTDQQDADTLRHYAEQTGFVLAPQIGDFDNPNDFWYPIRKATHANGFSF